LGKKVMLINATDSEEIRVAVLKDGVLSDFDIEFVHNEKIKGNVYKAKVIRVDQSLQAAFVHYGAQKNGFLPIGELPKDLVSPDGRRGRIQDLLQRDQEIMVQVVREELGTKGAMVTAQISLPGRYLVLTPGNAINGISRKIEDRGEREHFRELVDGLEVPAGMGIIVRTASLGVTKEDFEKDLGNLLDTYKEVQANYKSRAGVGLVWQEDDVVTRTLRDTWAPDIGEVHIDDHDTFQSALAFFRRTMPQHLGALHHYNGKKPIFSKFQTEEQIERIYARRVPLPSGGAIVIDQTEALVAIDVNSGKTSGDNQEDTALKANLEATDAIALQLRLRDLAGLVAIDFIDMKRETNNKAVMDRLVECLRQDRARMEVGKINRFGVLVMTRQRIRPSIQKVTPETCTVCHGTGQVKNIESFALGVLRRIKSALVKNGIAKLSVRLAPPMAMNLLNQRRQELAELESAHGASIVVTPDHSVIYGEIEMDTVRREEEPDAPKRHEAHEKREQRRDAENETVVLDGDAPISFDKALGHQEMGDHADRRVAQRAALDERERLRSLFEKPKGKDDKDRDGGDGDRDRDKGKDRDGAKGKEASGTATPTHRAGGHAGPNASSSERAPQKAARHAPALPKEPPKLSPEVIASLAIPTRHQRLSVQPADAPSAPDAPDATHSAVGGTQGAKPTGAAQGSSAAAAAARGRRGKARPAPEKPPEKAPEKAPERALEKTKRGGPVSDKAKAPKAKTAAAPPAKAKTVAAKVAKAAGKATDKTAEKAAEKAQGKNAASAKKAKTPKEKGAGGQTGTKASGRPPAARSKK
jgi:ribonuclease E